MSEANSVESKINFTVHNIYIKDVSFEAPNSPQIFTLEWKPKLEFDIQMQREHLEENLYEVTLVINVNVVMAEATEASKPKTAFIVEVKQSGVFMLEGINEEQQLDYILSTTAPTILFPYAREVVSSLVTKGGFPQLIIPPMNFESMYQQHLAGKSQATQQVAHA